ncbi:MAG: isoaspartyl peptidase/L-asparaginase [Candidatus Thermoplasmatota archaeon]|nr:isoaspartyl peptidase/L-asparaginase [Candidatus Thermoplasmatota archaeon]
MIGVAPATGWGEKIISVVLAKSALELVKDTKDPMKACRLGIEILADRVDGYGGLVMVTRKGRVGYDHNTLRMAFAFKEGPSGREHAGIRA